MKYIWEETNMERLINSAQIDLHVKWKEEAWPFIDIVLRKKLFTILSFSLTRDEFIRNVGHVAISISTGTELDLAIMRRRNHEKNTLDRCTPTDELTSIKSNTMNKEMKELLISEQKAVRTKTGEVIVHPLLRELACQR